MTTTVAPLLRHYCRSRGTGVMRHAHYLYRLCRNHHCYGAGVAQQW